MPAVRDESVSLKSEHYDDRLHGVFALHIGAEAIEIISECEHPESLSERYLGSAHRIHGHLIVEIDEVILLMNDVSIVVWAKKDGLHSCQDSLSCWLHYFHINSKTERFTIWYYKPAYFISSYAITK